MARVFPDGQLRFAVFLPDSYLLYRDTSSRLALLNQCGLGGIRLDRNDAAAQACEHIRQLTVAGANVKHQAPPLYKRGERLTPLLPKCPSVPVQAHLIGGSEIPVAQGIVTARESIVQGCCVARGRPDGLTCAVRVVECARSRRAPRFASNGYRAQTL